MEWGGGGLANTQLCANTSYKCMEEIAFSGKVSASN